MVNRGQHALVKKVAQALRQRCGVSAGDRVLVAVSGGADSVALLRALADLAPRRRWDLALAIGHVQHHLRPPEASEADALFVADLARKLDLPHLRADLDPNGPGNTEGRARRLRYAALADMASACDARFIAVAHHGDDQLETVLMRLLRGAALKGLAGMAWRRRLEYAKPQAAWLIRPLLGATRADVLDYLRSLNQPWREDHTNADTSRRRASLRHDVLPLLRRLQPDAAEKTVRLADHFRSVARVLDQAVALAADRVVRTDNGIELDRVEARQLPTVVLTGLLRRLLIEAGAGADHLGTRALRPLIRAIGDTAGGQRWFPFHGGVRVEVAREQVRITTGPADA